MAIATALRCSRTSPEQRTCRRTRSQRIRRLPRAQLRCLRGSHRDSHKRTVALHRALPACQDASNACVLLLGMHPGPRSNPRRAEMRQLNRVRSRDACVRATRAAHDLPCKLSIYHFCALLPRPFATRSQSTHKKQSWVPRRVQRTVRPRRDWKDTHSVYVDSDPAASWLRSSRCEATPA